MEMRDSANDKYQNNSMNVDDNNTQLMQEIKAFWLRNGMIDVTSIPA
jgi:hypothetical protein